MWPATAPQPSFEWNAKAMITWLQGLGLPGADLRDNRLGAWAMDACYSEIAMRCRGGPPQISFQAWPRDFYKALLDSSSVSSYNAVNLGNLVREQRISSSSMGSTASFMHW